MAIQPMDTNREPGINCSPVTNGNGSPTGDYRAVCDQRGQTRFLWMNTPLEELSSIKLCQLLRDRQALPDRVAAAIARELRLRGEEDLPLRWQPPH